MKPTAPWSVKGIDRDAREAAKEAARREGLTLGEWFNRVIEIAGQGEGGLDKFAGSLDTDSIKVKDLAIIVGQLGERIAKAQAASTEQGADFSRNVGGMVERVQRLEQTSSRNLKIEQTLIRLAEADQARVKSLKALETAIVQIADQFNKSQQAHATRFGDTDKRLTEIAEKLSTAKIESAEPSALGTLKTAVDQLAKRVASVETAAAEATALREDAASSTNPSFVAQTEKRLRILGNEIRRGGEQNRVLEKSIAKLAAHIEAAERRSAVGVDKVTQTITGLKQELSGRQQMQDSGRQELEAALASLTDTTDRRLSGLQTAIDELADQLRTGQDEAGTSQRQIPAKRARIATPDAGMFADTKRKGAMVEDDDNQPIDGDATDPITALAQELERLEELSDDPENRDKENRDKIDEDTGKPAIASDKAERDIGAPDAGEDDDWYGLFSLVDRDDDGDEAGEDEQAGPDAESANPALQSPDSKPGYYSHPNSIPGAITHAADTSTNAALSTSPGAADEISRGSQNGLDDIMAELDALGFSSDDTDANSGHETVDVDEALVDDDFDLTKPKADPLDELPSHGNTGNDDDDSTAPEVSAAVDTPQPLEEAQKRRLTPRQRAVLQAKIKRKRLAAAQAEIGADDEDENFDSLGMGVGVPSELHAERAGNQSDLDAIEDAPSAMESGRRFLSGIASRPVLVALGAGIVLSLTTFGFLIKDALLGDQAILAGVNPQQQPEITIPRANDVEQPAVPVDPRAVFDNAIRALNAALDNGQQRAAIREIERAADLGHPPAQLQLGEMRKLGQILEQDLTQARTWYRRAANGGNVLAMHRLGVMTSRGEGGPSDLIASVSWFEKSANLGLLDSQFNLGASYHPAGEEDQFGIKDRSKAYFWYSVAARNGDTQADELATGLGGGLTSSERSRIDAEVTSWIAQTPDPVANERPAV